VAVWLPMAAMADWLACAQWLLALLQRRTEHYAAALALNILLRDPVLPLLLKTRRHDQKVTVTQLRDHDHVSRAAGPPHLELPGHAERDDRLSAPVRVAVPAAAGAVKIGLVARSRERDAGLQLQGGEKPRPGLSEISRPARYRLPVLEVQPPGCPVTAFRVLVQVTERSVKRPRAPGPFPVDPVSLAQRASSLLSPRTGFG